ncbi:MAG: GTP-binding protein [Planctomycetota bacterium]|jgi:small GTP-binding protein|nr:GTP-binding protein [Planctomycetota bacterium]
MINKKVCMLGGFSVGKTSLVERYVHSIFSDRYLSTVGVKISKKTLSLEGTDVTLVLWDMEGKDIYANVNMSYLRGAMGFFTVADGTRKETLETAMTLRQAAFGVAGDVPSYLLVNKADMRDQWEIPDDMLDSLAAQGVAVLCTSAKTGAGVEEAFAGLARDMIR